MRFVKLVSWFVFWCVTVAGALGACDSQTTERAKADAKVAGEKIDRALDRTAQRIAEAAKHPSTGAPGTSVAVTATGSSTNNSTTSIATGSSTSLSVSGVPETTREKVADAAITTSVKAGILKDPDLSVLRIDVDTNDGVVTLAGSARDDAARERAGKIASSVKGVREVRNNLHRGQTP